MLEQKWTLLVSLPCTNKTPEDKLGRVWACLYNQLPKLVISVIKINKSKTSTAPFTTPEPVPLLLMQVPTELLQLPLQAVKRAKVDETWVYRKHTRKRRFDDARQLDPYRCVQLGQNHDDNQHTPGEYDRIALLTTHEQQDTVSDII